MILIFAISLFLQTACAWVMDSQELREGSQEDLFLRALREDRFADVMPVWEKGIQLSAVDKRGTALIHAVVKYAVKFGRYKFLEFFLSEIKKKSSEDALLILFKSISPECIAIEKNVKAFRGMGWSRHGEVCVLYGSNSVKIYTQLGEMVFEYNSYSEKIISVGFYASREPIIATDYSGTVRLWDHKNNLIAQLGPSPLEQWQARGKRFVGAAATFGSSIMPRMPLYAELNALYALYDELNDEYIKIKWSPRFEYVAILGKKTFKLWNITNQSLLEVPNNSKLVEKSEDHAPIRIQSFPTAIQWSLDGIRCAVIYSSRVIQWGPDRVIYRNEFPGQGSLRIFDLQKQEEAAFFKSGEFVSLSSNFTHILMRGASGVSVRKVNDAVSFDLEDSIDFLHMKFSLDDASIVGWVGTKLKIWQLNGKCGQTIEYGLPIKSIKWSNQGWRIITECTKDHIKIFDITGKCLASLKHKAPVTGIKINCEGNRAITSCADNSVHLWALGGTVLDWVVDKIIEGGPVEVLTLFLSHCNSLEGLFSGDIVHNLCVAAAKRRVIDPETYKKICKL